MARSPIFHTIDELAELLNDGSVADPMANALAIEELVARRDSMTDAEFVHQLCTLMAITEDDLNNAIAYLKKARPTQ